MNNVRSHCTIAALVLLGTMASHAQIPAAQGSTPAATTNAQSAPSQAAVPAPSGQPAPPQAAAQTTEPKPPMAPEAHSADWAPLQYVEMWNTGNIATEHQNEIFNNSVVIHVNQGARIFLDPVNVARTVTAWRASMPDLHFTVEDTIIEGDKVVLRSSFTGTYTKRLFPKTEDPPKSGPLRKFRSEEILIFHLKNGKISEIWEMYNEARMRAAMGSGWCTAEEIKTAAMASHPPVTAPQPQPPAAKP